MEIKFPESSIVDPPHKVDGDFHVAKESFFELAKSRIRYLNSDEYNKWFKSIVGEENDVRSAPVYTPFWMTFKENSDGSEDRSIENLEIVINKDEFIIDGESFEDLIPFILEHEIQESWLNAKRGFLDSDSSGFHTPNIFLLKGGSFILPKRQG